MTVPCDDGLINLRVGAIILKNGKILMVGNDRVEYLYSVGGRIKFGETSEEAVVREVFEETGDKMEVDRLGFIHEEFLRWIEDNDPIQYYPEFFRTELLHPEGEVKHFVKDER
ncbi:MAG: NUDIX domain-containing protein [Lachnospiraceae bacterium]|nr:NUDIX domain-containing protein [Lachnospiraceae bacterium]